jgi:hypothetical protein
MFTLPGRAGPTLPQAAVLVAALGAWGAQPAAWAQDGGQGQAEAAPTVTGVRPAGGASPPLGPAAPPSPAPADATEMPEVVVRGRAEDLLGVALSASQGAVGEADMQDLPLLRRGELLETVPGMVVTQHSGDGKANQYFLRGFNLDHGTDFAFSVDGIPVNLPSHAHGQGYSDLNFMIPELVDFIDFKKGPFYAEVGDFSGAGAADVHLVSTLRQGIINLQGGEFGYLRALAAASPAVGVGTLLYAFEYNHYNGPWVLPENSNRFNGLLRYHWGAARDQYNLTASVYAAPEWHSTDQIPARAIQQGLSRFGAIDPSDGGDTGRGALSFNWIRSDDDTTTKLTVYGFYYRLNLFSNFTYFLDHPEPIGDQFEQIDRRYVGGADVKRIWDRKWFGKNVENVLGAQLRNDYIPDSGLDHTADRQVLQIERRDRIEELSAGVYGNNQVQWTDWFKSQFGLRADVVAVDVDSDTAVNSGNKTAGLINPKASLIFGPWKKTELYLNLGSGFHSNDARGVTIAVDPTTGVAQQKVPLLVRTKGAEVGARTSIVPGLVTTLSLWLLLSDSELTFAGDAGDTQANGPSRKYGVEWASFYKPTPWLTFTADVSLTRARYTDNSLGGEYIANSIPVVISGVATVETPLGIYASARLRYFSSQPLIEDDSVREPASTMVDAKVGYRRGRYEVAADLLNLLDSQADDIAYFYTSRLAGEAAAGMNDIHVHPVEPFQVRVGLTAHY